MLNSVEEVIVSGKVFLVEEKGNPSTDYYLLPLLARCSEIIRPAFDNPPEASELDGATLIFVRYLSPAWVALLNSARLKLHRLIYFMDDDLLDARASQGLPLKYRFKLLRLITRRKGWLQRRNAELWVSTPYLANKYREWTPQLLRPSPLPSGKQPRCRFFYHGTAAHWAEILWLRDLVEKALEQDSGLSFEIVGDYRVNHLYRGLDRVTVVHPMPWPSFRSFQELPGRHIGLAPVSPGQFNQARSYTKFFDITRCGSVGIYSKGSLYATVVRDGVEGLLVDHSQQAWQEAILTLASDECLRSEMLGRAWQRLAELADVVRHPKDLD